MWMVGSFDGYEAPSLGSISPSTTFEVGGVEYTVSRVGYNRAGNTGFRLTVSPAPTFTFTLTVGSTELQSGNATRSNTATGRQYAWSGANPNWTDAQTVDVKLDIGLIDICDRSQAVAYAIVKATPSFDFCHMTSLLDLDDITELPGGRGTGLTSRGCPGRLDLSGSTWAATVGTSCPWASSTAWTAWRCWTSATPTCRT